ncbi:amino acid-binding protein [Dysgonomonas sp. BGC7]|uniref:amino acid-binding protein n=1 Tax=Dysgonomonas sp. BGC7 TaxID=1658008 RepID=UPI0006825AD8|nr:amino acid-binding protein [Dysgonomonas sp. BGC7]MBD8388470.1 amino acid-binding protein [Dysgonomonas sp. BGC7]
MTIKQLSVFIENKTGRINEVSKILGNNDINMTAFSLAENADFGILRMVVSDVEKAVEVLKEAHFGVTITDVVCFSCPNQPGALSTVLDYLAKENVFIEYMYAFSQGDTANIVIRPTDNEKCIEILSSCNCDLLNRSNLKQK